MTSATPKVRVGMIGTGFMARTHSACFHFDPRVALQHVASRSSESARCFAEEYGYATHGNDWRAVLDDPQVDVVDITAPNVLHAAITIAAIQADKHVIVEKPIATTLADARRVMEAISASGVLGLYAENRRFAPVLLEVKHLMDAGKIGHPHLVRINELGSGPTHAEWFWQPELSGGGALIDLGVHGLYVLEWLMDEEVMEVSAVARPSKVPGIEETMCTSMRFASGAVGQTVSSWNARGGIDLRAELFGDEGTLLIDHSRTLSGIHMYQEQSTTQDHSAPHLSSQSGWSYPQVEALRTRGSLGAMRHFIDCITEGAMPLCTIKEGYRVMQLVDAIYTSAREGRAVQISASATPTGVRLSDS
jgi:predicted dehydrogenase